MGSAPGTAFWWMPRKTGTSSLRMARRLGRKLLVLWLRRQAFVGLGVVDDFPQKLLAERRQRALPQFAGGFALFHETPLLGGDSARVHAIGKMVHGAAGDRIALPDRPFDRRDATVPREERGVIPSPSELCRVQGLLADARMAVSRHDQVGTLSDFRGDDELRIGLPGNLAPRSTGP